MWIGWIAVDSWRFTVYGLRFSVGSYGCRMQDAGCKMPLKNADATCGVESDDNCIPHDDGYV